MYFKVSSLVLGSLTRALDANSIASHVKMPSPSPSVEVGRIIRALKTIEAFQTSHKSSQPTLLRRVRVPSRRHLVIGDVGPWDLQDWCRCDARRSTSRCGMGWATRVRGSLRAVG
ncbi:hypothetical protein C8F01DRAFT_691559 [Mycena amicta]|nr:hypothetical protein C8F01DRAFT_691559 [Mycena amicta]